MFISRHIQYSITYHIPNIVSNIDLYIVLQNLRINFLTQKLVIRLQTQLFVYSFLEKSKLGQLKKNIGYYKYYRYKYGKHKKYLFLEILVYPLIITFDSWRFLKKLI